MQKQKTFRVRPTLAALGALFAAGCAGGGDGGGIPGTSGDFVVLRTVPSENGQLFLNESIAFEFSNKVDLTSADFNSISFAVFDLNDNQLSEPVPGTFAVTRAVGDTEDGRRLEFVPRFPRTDSFGDGGFRPGRKYIVNLVKGDHRRGVGLLDEGGKGLSTAFSFSFHTADGTTTSQLFKDTIAGGPRKTGFEVTPRVDPLDPQSEVELNELGQMGTEIYLDFDQPLNPSGLNVPVNVDLDPRTRRSGNRGRISLEYTERDGVVTWIPASVVLEKNTLESSRVVLRPLGVLPSNTTVRVVASQTLEDMSGESNVNNAAYNQVFGSFKTSSSFELRFDAVVENFIDAKFVDLEAAFIEPIAEVRPGGIRASFDFEGGFRDLDYEPSSQEVVLDTDFTQITPKNGQPINVANGIFNFRNVRIPAGVTVRANGSRPMVWLVTGDFIVEGNLTVSGGEGQRVDTLNSANFPSGGGIGNAGGGNGGRGTPKTSDRSFNGEAGFGPGQTPNGGGGGGSINCRRSGCDIGSGGGGGSFATQGDPYFKAPVTGTFVQPSGRGGYGCENRTSTALPGGNAGPLVFTDPRPNNDFWGSALDRASNIRISGELVTPQGGQGGGGGGDQAGQCTSGDPGFASDEKGGGGGAGGGVLIIKALGKIEVTASGRISADGGHGGGGAWAGANTHGGGGGAGAGGMVVLMAGDSIVLHTHIVAGDGTYTTNDYSFSVTADGGVSKSDTYAGGSYATYQITNKYQGPHDPNTPNRWNTAPTGGFGGMGIIQLMVPPGDPISTSDGTNTILDDNIRVMFQGAPLMGADKERFLTWRGTPDSEGVFRNDAGDPVIMGRTEGGDLRPRPILMPAPFGSRSRVRSKWIDLGVVNRTIATAPDSDPRGVVVAPPPGSAVGDGFGPVPLFAGLDDEVPGFVRTVDHLGGVRIDYPVIVSGLVLDPDESVKDQEMFRGRSAFRVKLASANATLIAEGEHRYSNYTAVLRQGVTQVGELRILGHDGSSLFLDSADGKFVDIGGATSIDVLAKFFSVYTGDTEGFPQSFIGRSGTGNPNLNVPRANIRISMAFHQNPADANALRYPPIVPGTELGFFADWNDPVKLEEIRSGHYRYMMYDIIFDTDFEVDPRFPNNAQLGPDTPRPEIRRLVLPYRY